MNKVIQKIVDLSTPFEEADIIPNIFGKFQNDALMGTIPVVLYGAGSAGKELYPVLKMHGIDPVCFCDSNILRVGELHCGLTIISINELQQYHNSSLIVVTTVAYRDQVKHQLVEAGFEQEKVLTISNQEAMCYYTHIAQWYWPEHDLISHADALHEVFNILSDQKSRDIFTSRIALFVRGADYQSFQNFISIFSDVTNTQSTNFQECLSSINNDGEAYLQFNNDLVHLENNEVFIDGGAFTGDSTLEFINACMRQNLTYKNIICFEPDSMIFKELQKNTAQFNNISLKPFGLWSHRSTIRFADSNLLKPGSTKIISEIDENITCISSGISEIFTTSIDEQSSNERVSIIKMDIEGAEIEALRGAIKTITKYRPKLIISAYHKRNDLFEIPLLLHRMVPDYKLYYRHFSCNFGETTLFAIPL